MAKSPLRMIWHKIREDSAIIWEYSLVRFMGVFPSFFFGINNLKKTDDENEYSIVTKFKYISTVVPRSLGCPINGQR